MKFGIDVDGVIRDVHEEIVKVYKQVYPDHSVTPVKDWYQWDISIFFPIGKGLYKFFSKDHIEIYSNATLLPGAIEMMNGLYKLEKYQ